MSDKEKAQELKAKGNTAFSAKQYEKAAEYFTNALEYDPNDQVFYSNRSACYASLEEYDKALADGRKCVELKPDWSKGYARKGLAEFYLRKYEEAIATYTKGLELEPGNQQMKEGLEKAQQQINQQDQDPFFGAEAMAKLMSNPRTAGYFKDPKFMQMFNLAKSNPQMFMPMMQNDPRFKDVMGVVLGVDLDELAKEQDKAKEKDAEQKKRRDEEEKQKAEMEKKKKEEEEEKSMSTEEREAKNKKKQSEEHKAKGNDAYKKKNFDLALTEYSESIKLSPEELNYYTNKAAVYFEKGQYNECINECDQAIEVASKIIPDFQKLSKAFARKANAYSRLNDFDKAIEFYNKALLEHNDPNYKDALKKAEKTKKLKDEEAYLNPEIGEQHRVAGNQLFEKGNFPGAVKEYTEGLRRDPKNPKIFSNRCAAYMKLMEYPTALKDAEKCIDIDPTFVKAYARKGNIHFMLKEFHKALETYDKGLKIEPSNKECLEGRIKTSQAINMGSHAGSENDEERVRHAMADPEIRLLLTDPRVQQILKDFQENPTAAQDAMMKDVFLQTAISKLIAAGVLKTK